MSKLKTIVCHLYPNHPNGRMNRAGFVFTSQPQRYDVTDDELKAIEAEPKIKIVEESKRAFEIGFENIGQRVGHFSDSKLMSETGVSDVRNSQDNGDKGNSGNASGSQVPAKATKTAPQGAKGPAGDNELIVEPKEAPEGKKMERFNKAELFFALNKAGLVAGKDYQVTAANSLLLQLLQVTTSKTPPQ